jgi:hypothetical protein
METSMQQLYRAIVTPYGYDIWNIFTEDKELFDKLSKFYSTDELIEEIGHEEWEKITDACLMPTYPYVLLGETELRQRD